MTEYILCIGLVSNTSVYILMCAVCACCFAVPSPVSIPGELRVQLLNQTLLDLGLYDDGPYEVADQKQLNAQLIPVPSHSYLGRTRPLCSLLPVHRREREGRCRATPRLRLYSNMAAKTPGARNSSSCQTASNWSFPVDYLWMSLSVCDSQSPEWDSTSFFLNVFPCECGWTCEKCPELIVAWHEFG